MNWLIRPPLPEDQLSRVNDRQPVAIGLPISKSIAARHLVMDLLGHHRVEHPISAESATPLPDDIKVLVRALEHLSKESPDQHDLPQIDIGESGTALRLLTAACCVCNSNRPIRIDGIGRIGSRPMAPLIHALSLLGADIRCEGREGFAPLVIHPATLNSGQLEIDASQSSQFVTALMLIAPYLTDGLTLSLSGVVVSEQYIRLTAQLMQERGVCCNLCYRNDMLRRIEIPVGRYKKRTTQIEADWSAACFWIEYICAVPNPYPISLKGLRIDSSQADQRMAQFGSLLGCELSATEGGCTLRPIAPSLASSHIIANVSACPDLVPALVLTGLLRGIPFALEGIAHLKYKESDRIEALCQGARSLGFDLLVEGDSLAWDGKQEAINARSLPLIHTFADHRIAMAFALACARSDDGILLDDIDVAAKSYPSFFTELSEQLGFRLSLVPSR